MKATIESKNLQDALRMVASATGGPELVNLVAQDKQLYVVAQGLDVSVRLRVKDSSVEGKGHVTVGVNALIGLTKNRGQLLLENSKGDSKLSVSSVKGGRYTGDVVIPPYSAIDAVEAGDKAKHLKFDTTVQTVLAEAIERVALNNVHTNEPLYLTIDGSNKTTSVICGDAYHLAFYHHPNVDIGKKNLVIPLTTFRTIQNLAGKDSKFKMSLEGSYVFAANEDMSIALPMMQPEDVSALPKVSEAQELFASLKKNDGKFTIEREKLVTALGNINSVAEADVPLQLSIKDNKLKLRFESGQSNVQETIKVSDAKWGNKLVIKLDPGLLGDILSPITTKEVTIIVRDENGAFIKVTESDVVTYYSCVVE